MAMDPALRETIDRVFRRIEEREAQADMHTSTDDPTKRKARLLDDLIRQTVPPRLAAASPKHVPQIPAGVCDGDGVFMTGPPGIGKSYAASAIARLYLWRKTEPVKRDTDPRLCYPSSYLVWTTAARLMSRIHSSYGRTFLGETQEQIIMECVRARVLVLDDLGAVKTTEHAAEILQRVLNDRDDAMMFTIITSNLTLEEIETWRPGIASRLGRMTRIWLPDKDRRLSN